MRTAICKGCGVSFTVNGNVHKYCTYKCGDKIRAKAYRDAHVSVLKYRRIHQWLFDPRHRQKVLARHGEWRKRNSEWVRKYARAHYHATIHQRRFSQRVWYLLNREQELARGITRKAAKLGYPLYITPPDLAVTKEAWKIILSVWDYRCAYCRNANLKLTQDHVIPLSKGGQHSVDNVVPACRSCNSSKSTMSVDEFFERLTQSSP